MADPLEAIKNHPHRTTTFAIGVIAIIGFIAETGLIDLDVNGDNNKVPSIEEERINAELLQIRGNIQVILNGQAGLSARVAGLESRHGGGIHNVAREKFQHVERELRDIKDRLEYLERRERAQARERHSVSGVQ